MSSIQSQNISLEMPRGLTKVGILVEDQDYISKDVLIAHTKLILRKNKINYFTDIDKKPPENGYLYIALNISELSDFGHYGNLSVQFKRNRMHQINFLDNLNNSYLEKKGRQALYGVSVWQQAGTFFYPKRYDLTYEVKNYLSQILDLFSSDFIDANNL